MWQNTLRTQQIHQTSVGHCHTLRDTEACVAFLAAVLFMVASIRKETAQGCVGSHMASTSRGPKIAGAQGRAESCPLSPCQQPGLLSVHIRRPQQGLGTSFTVMCSIPSGWLSGEMRVFGQELSPFGLIRSMPHGERERRENSTGHQGMSLCL